MSDTDHDQDPAVIEPPPPKSIRLELISGALLHRAWLKSGRRDPLIDADAWDGFALTVRAVAEMERIVDE